jgi:menaquinone-dependent protoporphyrinogen oxidase
MKKILILHASFKGATIEVAQKMKTILETKDCIVEIDPAENQVRDLSTYDLVILGCAIRGDTPHPAMLEFVNANNEGLKNKKTAVFMVCITITSHKASKRENASHYPEKISLGFKPEHTAVFGGFGGDAGWFGNLMGKMILGITPGDFRDWKKIEEWTLSLVKYS